MDRRTAISKIEQKLGSRKLIYFGTRGADAVTLSDISNFHSIFSQIAPLHAETVEEISLEQMKKERVDLDTYNIDFDNSQEVEEFRGKLYDAFASKSAVLPYRPCSLLYSTYFPNKDQVKYLGGFHELQSCFEYKPWVEHSLKKLDIKIIPWEYHPVSKIHILKRLIQKNPVVIRKTRSDGGAGFLLIKAPGDLEQLDNEEFTDDFFAVAPFLSKCISLNINACVFRNKQITIHPLSVQIIGEEQCTSRDFGYCGNDFGKAKNILDKKQVAQLQKYIHITGSWLHSMGYNGAFGIDFLVCENELYLTEINPRFQGSSAVSSLISKEMDLSDIYMDHISAFLNIETAASMTLRDLLKEQLPYSHVVCHNFDPFNNRTDLSTFDTDRLPFLCRLQPEKDVAIKPEAICFQALFRKAILNKNGKLLKGIRKDIDILYREFYQSEPPLFK